MKTCGSILVILLLATACSDTGDIGTGPSPTINRGKITYPRSSTVIADSATALPASAKRGGAQCDVQESSEEQSGSQCSASSPRTTSIVLTPDSAVTGATVAVGDILPLQVTFYDAQGNALPPDKVKFSSSDPAVATVSNTGVVTAVAEGGPVTITAKHRNLTATARITVVKPFILTQVGGQNIPAPIPNVPALVVVGGRVILYANGRYFAKIDYATGPVLDQGTFVQSGTQITFISDRPGALPVVGSLVGDVLRRSVFTFVR